MKNQPKQNLIAAAVAVFVIVGFIAYVFVDSNRSNQEPKTQSNVRQTSASTSTSRSLPEQQTQQLLLYLIEEEKLAHDVYTVMYEKYGAKVFGNILASESTHQEKVLTLLQARNIQDPRSTSIGVFQNVELQALYNSLISQGSKSVQDAYKVGVAIEEKDIKDISDQLSTTTDQDVISTLELLRSGSENHLRAFNRQL